MQKTPWFLQKTSNSYRFTAIGLSMFLPAYHFVISKLEGWVLLIAAILIIAAFRLALDLFVSVFRYEGLTLIGTVTIKRKEEDFVRRIILWFHKDKP